MAYLNKEKQKAACRRYHEKNREAVLARLKKRRAEARQYAWDWKRNHPCVDCGEDDPIVLDFDHRDPSQKFFNISEHVGGKATMKTLLEEIAKCDVRCANCHRRKTYFDFVSANI